MSDLCIERAMIIAYLFFAPLVLLLLLYCNLDDALTVGCGIFLFHCCDSSTGCVI